MSSKVQKTFEKLKFFYLNEPFLGKHITFREFIVSPLAAEVFVSLEDEIVPKQLND